MPSFLIGLHPAVIIFKNIQKLTFAAYSAVSSPTSLIGLDKDLWTLETSSQDRKRYDTILEQVLTQLEPVFMQEQQFCVKFFQVSLHLHISDS